MKDQVFMSPNNAEIVVGIPLFRNEMADQLESIQGYSIYISAMKPLAYILDTDHVPVPEVLSAEWIEKNLICLGDL